MPALDVNDGETYTVADSTSETWDSATADGELRLDGVLILDESESFTSPHDGLSFPTGLDLPLSPINLSSMQMGFAMFVVGLWALLGGAAAVLRNYAAGAVLGLAVIAFLMSGLLGVSLAYHWAMIIATLFVLVTGGLLRVMGK